MTDFISKKEIFKQLLNEKKGNFKTLNIYNSIKLYLDSVKSEKMMSFRDSTIFKPDINSEEPVLRIELSLDDFLTTNPLRSANKKQKLMAVYYTINNLPMKYQCKREDINLLMLVKREAINKLGINFVFKPIVDDFILLLEEGINVRVGNIDHNIKGYLSFILGDNLGIHEVLGLSCSFNSGKNI